MEQKRTVLRVVTEETAIRLGLLPEEYKRIQEILGRIPNFTELSIFSVMWSEHCSYKNSIRLLKTLPRNGERVLVEAGEENAGLVDIGEGLACAFKIESHNHPSAIEPYQGAATGVGGINRDIFTMGARPVAQLNSLRFGNPLLERTRWLVRGVVKGIGDYGNSFGIPVVGGEVYFDPCYNTNPLVNAMSVGIVRSCNPDENLAPNDMEHYGPKVVPACAKGPGNPVFIIGSSTGRDGIHGATFASENITDTSHEDLPSVQVGDPFEEKLLLEATQEAIRTGAIVGMQDMGAAGIICSTSEMSARGGCGMDIFLDCVPLRQTGMEPHEILLSESQERMLVVVEKNREEEVMQVFEKWDIHCSRIGKVTTGPLLRYFMNGVTVAEVPAQSLVLGGGAPVYEREAREPEYYKIAQGFSIQQVPPPEHLQVVTEHLISHPNIASRQWVYDQYDTMVGTATLNTNLPSDAAVVNLKGTYKALVLTTDCNARYVHADPYKGAAIAVAEAARNIVCTGGEPLAITNCLNFGNPYNPEVFWQFSGAVKGMGDACRHFGIPVTGGNVSFYNQTVVDGREEAVLPTPVIGMLGLLEDKHKQMTLDFKEKGDLIYLLGRVKEDLASSEYLYSFHNVKHSPPPYFDIEEEHALHQAIKTLIRRGVIRSAHDVSDGGLFIALLESAMPRELGFDITTPAEIRKDAFLFGESQGRVVISFDEETESEFIKVIEDTGVPFTLLGHVTKGEMRIDDESFGFVKEAKEVYENVLQGYIDID